MYLDGLPPIGDLRQAQVSALRATQSETEKDLSPLMPSILGKAFRGELVEQDPEDESAERVLERIRKVKEKP